MPVRFIIRPASILSTPRRLKESLDARRTYRWPQVSRHKPSILKDFFICYPPIEELEEYAHSLSNETQQTLLQGTVHYLRPSHESNQLGILATSNAGIRASLDNYTTVRAFAAATKPAQRSLLRADGFPTPFTAFTQRELEGSGRNELHNLRTGTYSEHENNSFIVRPLRHSQGRGWRLTSDPSDFQEGREYVQEVYPKNHEYRILAVRGTPLVTLLKRRPEHLTQDQPWNHANGSTFITVTDESNNRLRHTNVYQLIEQSQLLKGIDLCGIDVMYSRRNDYAIAEVNLCPSLAIESNLQRISNHVLSLPQFSR
jgi:hypothetical protein